MAEIRLSDQRLPPKKNKTKYLQIWIVALTLEKQGVSLIQLVTDSLGTRVAYSVYTINN